MNLSARDLAVFLTATIVPPFLLALMMTGVMRWLAPKIGLVDQPNARKVHASPIPLGGGIGIWFGVFATFALASIAIYLIHRGVEFPFDVPEFARTHAEGMLTKLDSLWLLLGAGSVLMLVGLADDRWQIGWQLRLSLQFGIAFICVWFGDWKLTAFIDTPWLTILLSMIWIVALVNSFNMLDNMDGLSGGIAMISSFMLAAVLMMTEDSSNRSPQLFVAGLLLVIGGSVLGFLFHNRPPAKIFMGDAGSYFLGSLIAVATMLATFVGYNSTQQHAILAPLFVMAVPFYDMITVIAIRLRNGRSPFHADKNHLSHRLVDLGFTKVQAVSTIYLLTATCGLAALLLHRVDFVGAVILSLLVICVLALIGLLEKTARRKIKSGQ
jgi:UDP-GlcNAc:undecaprenyl-phosphate/decaprenyl-phosphate GlcNAc-1-phosphate transferase